MLKINREFLKGFYKMLKINKDFMGDEYLKRPLSECESGDGQSGAPVYWVSDDKIAVGMPMRLSER